MRLPPLAMPLGALAIVSITAVVTQAQSAHPYQLCAYNRPLANELECVPPSIGCGFNGKALGADGVHDREAQFEDFDACLARCVALAGTRDPNSIFAGASWGPKFAQCNSKPRDEPAATGAYYPDRELLVGVDCNTDGAPARCVQPTQALGYYAEQGDKYFATLASAEPVSVYPNYTRNVVRWEWPPWLFLTGFGSFNMLWTDVVQKAYETNYYELDCRGFSTQPFARCHVVFNYKGRPCPIYEEFSFDHRGRITFIEAWTDHDGLLPMNRDDDYWAEARDVRRLSSKVPGLGNPEGWVDLDSSWMIAAAEQDADVNNFLMRARRPYAFWFHEVFKHVGKDVFDGCDPPD